MLRQVEHLELVVMEQRGEHLKEIGEQEEEIEEQQEGHHLLTEHQQEVQYLAMVED